MAIPSMVQNLYVQTANQQNLISWDLSAGATSYIIQSSLDNVTFSTLVTISGTPLATSYLDTAAALGVETWYKVAASSADGTSPYTISQSTTAAPAGEMTLGQIRLSSQQTADLVNSKFVTKPEWNRFINLAMYELYDLLITTYEDYSLATPAIFPIVSGQGAYLLPNGSNSFQDETGTSFVAKPFYKMLGVDLSVNIASNAWLTIRKFNFIDRNKYAYNNTSSAIYGVANCQYRVMGNRIELIPFPASAQNIRLWYIPRLQELLKDTDTSDIGISGWLRYVIVRAAIYALNKEESDTSMLAQELLFMKERIIDSASNRDAGQGETVSNTRFATGWGNSDGSGYGDGGW